MLRYILLIWLFATGFGLGVSAQYPKCPELPEKYQWNTAEEYARDRDLVKKTLRWLCKVPLGAEVFDRSLANAFVLEWLAGTPEFILDIKSEVLPSATEHPELLFTLIHGMALYKMEHMSEKDPVRLHSEGLEVVALLAEQSKELSHDRDIRRLIRAVRKNRLKNYTMDLLKKKDGSQP